jgi:glycerol dehydrogenase
MKAVLIAPRKYVQGRGVLAEAGTYVRLLGHKPLVLWDACVKQLVGDKLLTSLKEAGLEAVEVLFEGQSSKAEAARITEIARQAAADVVIAVGGGKTLDTGKAVAAASGTRMVTCPTIASTDSPTSAATVWYDAEGNCCGWDCWPANPDLVLVDSQVIVDGPVRAFVAGMGDALSTWVEAEAAHQSRAATLAGGVPTMAALAIARLCYDTLMEHGVEAKRAMERHALVPAVEKCIEANVLMSGLGFESGGLATAHMIGNTLSSYPECKGLMHGEKVAFGVVSQLCLDDEKRTNEIHAIVDFQIAVGLPVTLADVGLDGASRQRLRPIGDACAAEGSLSANHPFPVTAEDVIDAMLAADALGCQRKRLSSQC